MSMDDHLKKTLASKFEAFEAPVGEEHWEGIKGGIMNKPPHKVVPWRRFSVGLLLLLMTAVSTWLLVRGNDAEANDPGLAETGKTIREPEKSVNTRPGDDPVSNIPGEMTENAQQPLDHPGVAHLLPDAPQTTELHELKEVKTTTFRYSRAELQEPLAMVLPLTQIPSYQFQRNSDRPEFIQLTMSVSDSVKEQGKRVSFRPLLGLSLNYLNLRPNPGDNIYFTDIGTSVDLSFQQWGLSVGYEVSFHLSDGLKLRNELNLSLQQHRVSFRYLPDATDSENTEFLSVEETFRPLSLGIATGLSYDLGNLGLKNRELDLGLYYQSVIADDLGDRELWQYPGALINMNLGLTFYPQKTNWGIRVFTYYALNKKYSERPLTMTPYGFGVQFLRVRVRSKD